VTCVRRTVDLVRFLRKSEATEACMARIEHWRTYVPPHLFKQADGSSGVREEIVRCVSMHSYLDVAGAELKVVRRLNCLRLKEALGRLDPMERRAKARPFI